MDRRAFLRRAVGGTAVVVAGVQSGWALSLVKRLLRPLFRDDYNDWPPGLMDITSSTSLHQISDQHGRRWGAHLDDGGYESASFTPGFA